MAFDLAKPDLIVAVFGAGTMGRGIAQVCAQAGMTTLLFDSRDGAVKEAIAAVDKGLEGLVAKQRMTAAAKKGVLDHLKPINSLDDAKGAGIVIEAIVEDLGAKRELFRELEKRVSPECVLATNTSSLSVTEVAAGCERSERVGGLHFFNPPPLMRLVEVIGGLRSDPALVAALVGFVKRINKHPVVATDTPGFVVNHAGRAYGPEALRIVSQGIASPREVDLLMKEAAGFRMGPFELLDLVGGDVAHAVMVSIFEQYFDDPMYQPSANMAVRVAGGLLGRKTRRGFYNYDKAEASGQPTVAVSPQSKPASAWVADEEGGRELANWLSERRREGDARRQPAVERTVLCHAAGRRRVERLRSPQARPGANGCRRYVWRFPGTAYGDENAAHERRYARRRGRRVVGRENAGDRDQRQPGFCCPAHAGHDRQYRNPHRRTAHRRAGRHRYRGRTGAQLSERTVGLR